MGYRSDIGILITLPENVSAKEIIDKFRKAYGEEDFDDYFEVDEDVRGCVYLHVSDVKWYEGKDFGYKEVNNVMELVRNWEEHFKTGGIHYIRIGEAYDDLEEIVNGDVEEYLGVSRTIELP